MLLGVLQDICMDLTMICQAKGSTLLPLTSPTNPGKDFLESTSILLQYLHIALKCTLDESDPTRRRREKRKEALIWSMTQYSYNDRMISRAPSSQYIWT